MMKGITKRFFRLAAIGKLAIVILSLMGFASVVSAHSEKELNPPSQVQQAPQVVKKPHQYSQPDIITEEIPFSTTTVENPDLEKGKSVVRVQGVNGVRTNTFYVAYVDGVEVSRLHISTEVTKEPVNQVVEVGAYEAPAPSSSHGNDQGPDPASIPSYCQEGARRNKTIRRLCEEYN